MLCVVDFVIFMLVCIDLVIDIMVGIGCSMSVWLVLWLFVMMFSIFGGRNLVVILVISRVVLGVVLFGFSIIVLLVVRVGVNF